MNNEQNTKAPVGTAGSVDTPEFQALLLEWRACHGRPGQKSTRDALIARIDAHCAAQVAELKANHADMVKRCAILRERDDLPVDRLPAYRELVRLQEAARAAAPDPHTVDTAFLAFCDRQGYPSDDEIDTAIRDSFDEAVRVFGKVAPDDGALTDAQIDALRAEIITKLGAHRMVNMFEQEPDGDGQSYPLIDRLSLEADADISSGNEEIEAIADAVMDCIDASAILAAASKPVKPEREGKDKGESAWRRLALQFDGHRMQAIGHLKCMVRAPDVHKHIAEAFLSAGPLSGEEVLAKRIAALAAPAAQPGERDAAPNWRTPEIEARAKVIYAAYPGANRHPWVEHGNSTRQEDARYDALRFMSAPAQGEKGGAQ